MNFTADIENCLTALKNGGLILYPTDTIWGIGCDATNEKAVEKIYVVKERPPVKSLIVLVSDEREILKYVASPDLRVFDYLEKTQRPTTVIYDNAIGLASNLVPEDGSVAIRIVKNEFCKHLIKRFRKPIVSTSANLSGQQPPSKFSEINKEIKKAVDYVVQYRQNDNEEATASSIVRWENGNIRIIRE
jgi:L-threonylcarbamoyladenylate synthase